MGKQISFRQILLVFLFTMGFHSLNSAITHSSEINNQSQNAIASAKRIQTNRNHKFTQDFLLTKKTGGRGSFNRSEPSRSRNSSSSPSSSTSSSSSSSDSSYSHHSSSGSMDGRSA